MLEFLRWLENSGLGETLRGLGVWTYGILNLGHIAGIAILFGSVMLLDLRMLGRWSSVPLSTVTAMTVPLSIAGFVLAVISGICMLTFNATEYYGNPFLLIKFPALLLAVLNVVIVSRLRAWRERARRELTAQERVKLAIAGGISLACWSVTLAAGRMIGYW